MILVAIITHLSPFIVNWLELSLGWVVPLLPQGLGDGRLSECEMTKLKENV